MSPRFSISLRPAWLCSCSNRCALGSWREAESARCCMHHAESRTPTNLRIPQQREESMSGTLSRTTFHHWNRRDALSDDSSLEAVCLFSALGVILSLAFLLIIGPDAAFTQ